MYGPGQMARGVPGNAWQRARAPRVFAAIRAEGEVCVARFLAASPWHIHISQPGMRQQAEAGPDPPPPTTTTTTTTTTGLVRPAPPICPHWPFPQRVENEGTFDIIPGWLSNLLACLGCARSPTGRTRAHAPHGALLTSLSSLLTGARAQPPRP
jgi:hypothetical protein